ncbi:MAG: dethiobiotin synthase [Crocinitomicaceae bacterium]|nr:dethiobiotin synthase [Crocinitomicaceae bacterium]|tara:strand:+ start:112732 stop:113346 length:615 start_codon:yes stop_codon:yes gene_type:complete
MNKQFVITGIGTDVGKTVVSSIIAESLKAVYWKPIQAGDLNNSDSQKVARYTSNVTILREAYSLSTPISPHAAADIDGLAISSSKLKLPVVKSNFIIEGAGGLMVPLNKDGLNILDLIALWDLETIIVSRHYLGSINHSLLTAEILKHRGIKIAGFIFVGNEKKSTESIILNTSGLKMIARIPIVKKIDKSFILNQSEKIKSKL